MNEGCVVNEAVVFRGPALFTVEVGRCAENGIGRERISPVVKELDWEPGNVSGWF